MNEQSRCITLLGVLGVACLSVSVGYAQPPAGGQGGPPGPGGPGGPGGRGGGMMQQERKVLVQFDANTNGWLDVGERKAAREWLASQPVGGPGGRGGRGGRGGFPGGGRAPGSPGKRLAPADVTSYPASKPLYDLATLRTVFLQFENADWEQELAAFHNTDVDVPATVIVDGKTYKDVGVHFRGASSYFMVPEGSKRSLNLAFNFVHEDQSLGGYHTLNLLNANSDSTFVRTVLYSEISRAYIPTPKANYMRVAINNESWGIYVNVEQFNKDFIRDNFKATTGARWKVPGSPGGRGGLEYLGDDIDAYKRVYEIKTKDDPKVWRDFIALCRTLNETPPEKLEAALAPLLDIDGALKFIALDVVSANTDGYWTRASDYNIYQDAKGRFHILPHDMNEALIEDGGGRGFGGRGPGGPPPGMMPPDAAQSVPPPGGGLPPGFQPPPGGQPMQPPGGRQAGPGGFGGRGPGGGRAGGPELDPLVGLTDPTKPLRSKLLAVPALRAKYDRYVRDIAETWLDWKKVGPMVQQYQALIAEDVKADTRKLYSSEAFEADLATSPSSLKSFLDRRRAFLLK